MVPIFSHDLAKQHTFSRCFKQSKGRNHLCVSVQCTHLGTKNLQTYIGHTSTRMACWKLITWNRVTCDCKTFKISILRRVRYLKKMFLNMFSLFKISIVISMVSLWFSHVSLWFTYVSLWFLYCYLNMFLLGSLCHRGLSRFSSAVTEEFAPGPLGGREPTSLQRERFFAFAHVKCIKIHIQWLLGKDRNSCL